MGRPYFETKDLTVGYGGRPLVSGISLSLERGQAMTLIGPNGSGKSTILRTIARRIPAISGSVLLEGRDMRTMDGRTLATRMAVMLTERARPELMTCFEVAAAGRYPYTGSFGVLTARDREIVGRALRQVNVGDIADRDFMSVSDGQRQRVLLARAIAQEPELLIMDEPTSFLDIKHKVELLEILRSMRRERGVAVIMSLHEIDLAAKASDEIVCVGDNGITAWGAPEDIFCDDGIAALYGIERGSYNAALGFVELARVSGGPRVFVVGGGGYGLNFYRGLQKAGIPFAAGILFDNDMELPVASALAVDVIKTAAFLPAGQAQVSAARAAVDKCGIIIDAGCPKEGINAVNGELIRYAKALGRRIVTGLSEVMA